jgi:pyrimidine-specific ribonucleoside hydrolase
MPIPLVLDVDTGVDDAFALMLATRHRDVDLRAVTCVAGNAPVERVVANTCYVLDAAGAAQVPVARGADRPLLGAPHDASHVHGVDGLGGLCRASNRRMVPVPAIELLRSTLEAAIAAGEKVTLVPLAPQTNIALLLHAHPEVAAGIDRVVFMGGAAAGGNATAAAEFNVWHDPEAAAMVLAACATLAIEITMYGLDVFEQVVVNGDDSAALRARADPAAHLAGSLIDQQRAVRGSDAVTIGDAGAVCAAIDPGGLTTRRHPVHVETGAGPARGQTIVDRRSLAGDTGTDPHAAGAPPVDVALAVDAERYRTLWLATFDR